MVLETALILLVWLSRSADDNVHRALSPGEGEAIEGVSWFAVSILPERSLKCLLTC